MNLRSSSSKSIVAWCTVLLLAGFAALSGAAEISAGSFEFGLIGDQQYDAESEGKFPHLMSDLNQQQ